MLLSKSPLLRTLFFSQRMNFTVSSKEVKKRLNRITDKARLQETVIDKKKLQSFIEQSAADKSLGQAVDRVAKYKKEFGEFLENYKEKNKEFTNIIDLSHYAKDQELFKDRKTRADELRMLEEFRKRKAEKTLYLKSDDEETTTRSRKQRGDESDDEGKSPIEKDRFSRNAMASDVRRASHELLEKKIEDLYGGEAFVMLVMDFGMTTNVTTLLRVNHFRYLVFMGNYNGIIGYGKGQGGNFEVAFNNAVKDCKKNLMAISVDHYQTLAHPIDVHNNGMRLYLFPRSSMKAWGSPQLAAMLVLSGITHCSFKIVSRNPDPYNLIYCYFKALSKIRTPKEIVEFAGWKLYHQSHAAYKYRDIKPQMLY